MKTLTQHHEKKEFIDIVTLSGILNADTSPDFETLLLPLCGEKCPCILLDLSELSYISSAGIGCFIGTIKGVRMKGGDIRFSNMNSKIKRVFQLLDMDDFFQFYSSLDEGIASFSDCE